MRRLRPSFAAGLVVLAATAGCSQGETSEPTASSGGVRLKLLAFQPADLSVKAGTTVSWTNDEAIRHTVTSGTVTGVDPQTGLRAGENADGRFDHTLASKGQTVSWRFTEPGAYGYFCSIHKGMNATVVVTP